MSLTDTQRRRFEALSFELDLGSRFLISFEQLQDLCGLDLYQVPHLVRALSGWAAGKRWRTPVILGGAVQRGLLELYLAQQKLITRRTAQFRLAMPEPAFNEFIGRLADDSPLLGFGANDPLLPADFVSILTRRLPGLSDTFFSTRNRHIAALHSVARDRYKIEFDALRDVSGTKLGEKDPDFSYDYDVITLEPIGLRHQVWLNFGKPIAVAPDACSWLVYAQNRKLLEPFLLAGGNVPPAKVLTQLAA